MFPVLREKMNIDSEVEQHKALHDFLVRFIEMARKGQKESVSFDAAAMKTLLESAKDNLVSIAGAKPLYPSSQRGTVVYAPPRGS